MERSSTCLNCGAHGGNHWEDPDHHLRGDCNVMASPLPRRLPLRRQGRQVGRGVAVSFPFSEGLPGLAWACDGRQPLAAAPKGSEPVSPPRPPPPYSIFFRAGLTRWSSAGAPRISPLPFWLKALLDGTSVGRLTFATVLGSSEWAALSRGFSFTQSLLGVEAER